MRRTSVDQLVGLHRGRLTQERTALEPDTQNFAETWSLDMTGNWSQYQRDDGWPWALDVNQSRTHNTANEIVALDGYEYLAAHDRPGNMTRTLATDWNNYFDLTYDAWNRLVRAHWAFGEEPFTVEYQYDPLNRRTIKDVIPLNTISGIGYVERRHYYYSDQWPARAVWLSTWIGAICANFCEK